MVKSQITDGKRGNDAWAKADLAMAIMLSNDVVAANDEIPASLACSTPAKPTWTTSRRR